MNYKRFTWMVVLFFMFFSNIATAQSSQRADSLISLLEEKPLIADSTKYKIHKQIVFELKFSKPYEALNYIDKIEAYGRKINDKIVLALAYTSYGETFLEQGIIDRAMTNFTNAAILCNQVGDQQGMGYSLINIGNVFWSQDLFLNAEKFYNYAYEIFDKNDNQYGQAVALNNIGLIHRELGSYEKGLRYFRKALHLRESLKDTNTIIHSYQYIAVMYQLMEDYDNAMRYHRKTQSLNQAIGDIQNEGITLMNMGDVEFDQKHYLEAEKLFFKSISIFQKSSETALLLLNQLRISQLYIAQQKYAKAEKWAMIALQNAREHRYLKEQRDAERILFLIYKRAQNHKRALEHFERYTILDDSIMNDRIAKSISEADIKLETEKQAHELEVIKNAKELNKLELQKQKSRIINNVLLFATFITVVLVIISYTNNKKTKRLNHLLRKSNNEITQKSEKITHQKDLLEKQAKELEIINKQLEELSVVASEIDNSVIIFTPDGTFDWVNKGFVKMYGWNLETIIREKGKTIIEASDHPNIKELISKCVYTRSAVAYESVIQNRYGKSIHTHTTITPIIDKKGKVAKLVAIDTNITQIKESGRLKKRLEIEEEASKTKAQFLSNMGHEMRTPMNGMIGLLNYLITTDLNEEQRSVIKTILDSSKNLMKLINDILVITKLENKKTNTHIKEINLKSLLTEIKDLFSAATAEKNLQLELIKNDDYPSKIMADENILKQILTNIVSNAVRFTDEGGIKIKYEITSQTTKGINTKISIIDTGIGIKAQDQSLLFNKFTQIDQSNTRKHDGTGLGLSIAKGLVELLGGEIGVESKIDKGSTFWFTFHSKTI